MTDFLPGEAELIINGQAVEHTIALKNVVERRLNSIRDEYESNPHIDNEKISRDWRYKLGAIDALKWVLKRPDEAREHLKHLESIGG